MHFKLLEEPLDSSQAAVGDTAISEARRLIEWIEKGATKLHGMLRWGL